jgi:hypothetical protein
MWSPLFDFIALRAASAAMRGSLKVVFGSVQLRRGCMHNGILDGKPTMITRAAMAAALIVPALHFGAGPGGSRASCPRIEAAPIDSQAGRR